MNEILLYGEVGWENTSKSVVEQLATMDGDITLRVNSPGGDVYEGLGIMNALRGYQGGVVTAVIEGMAASAASFIVVGGADRIVARPNAEIMIHDAWTFVDGNAEKLAKTLADLERMSENLASIYAERTGGDPAEWRAKMKVETWFSAQEALDAGLVDAVEDARQPAHAGVKQPVFAKAFARFKYAGRSAAPAPELNAHTGQKGDAMSILNQLAQELGKKPEEVQAALSGFFNESLEVTTPIAVNYPDEVTVVPTGKVEVEPDVELPEGVEVVAEAPENFVAEVVEGGKVIIRATDAVSVDDTAEVTVTVGENSVIIKVTVVAADTKEEDATTTTGDAAPATDGEAGDTTAEFGEVPRGYALVPQAHLDDLTARAQAGDAAYSMKAEADLEAEVDGYIADGRFSAGLRNRVLADMKANADLARRTWGHLPKGSIPRSELGYGADHVSPDGSSAVDLIAKANANKNKTN